MKAFGELRNLILSPSVHAINYKLNLFCMCIACYVRALHLNSASVSWLESMLKQPNGHIYLGGINPARNGTRPGLSEAGGFTQSPFGMVPAWNGF